MFAVKFFKNWVERQSMTEWSSDPEGGEGSWRVRVGPAGAGLGGVHSWPGNIPAKAPREGWEMTFGYFMDNRPQRIRSKQRRPALL